MNFALKAKAIFGVFFSTCGFYLSRANSELYLSSPGTSCVSRFFFTALVLKLRADNDNDHEVVAVLINLAWFDRLSYLLEQ